MTLRSHDLHVTELAILTLGIAFYVVLFFVYPWAQQ